jgi:hypothetical protein
VGLRDVILIRASHPVEIPLIPRRRPSVFGVLVAAALFWAIFAATFTVGSPGSAQGSATVDAGSRAAPSCRERYRDWGSGYDREIYVYRRQNLSCSAAAHIGSAVATYYEHGLPLADYPPPPRGVPGGESRPFPVRTRLGRFSCDMTARGSDFVVATCAHGREYVRFESGNHAYVPKKGETPPNTTLCGEPSKYRYLRMLAVNGVRCTPAGDLVAAMNSERACPPRKSTYNYSRCTVRNYWCATYGNPRNYSGMCSHPGYADIVFAIKAPKAPGRSGSGRIFVAANGCHGHAWRPRTIIIACGDGNFYATGLRYSRYGGHVGRAKGQLHDNTCRPDCVHGHFVSYRGEITLSNIRRCRGRRYYTRISWRYTQQSPYPNGHTRISPFSCI